MGTYRGLAVSAEHRELAVSARAMLADRNALGAARVAADGTPQVTPEYWKDVANLGWLGLHLAQEDGGHGTSEIIRTQIAERVLGLPRG